MAWAPDPDYYEILGVDVDATAAEIDRAYRQRAAAAHPDTGGSSGLFRLLQIARDTLMDAARRRRYDERRAESSEDDDEFDSSWGDRRAKTEDRPFAPFPMPNLAQLPLEQAVGALRIAGVRIDIRYDVVGWSEIDEATVVDQTPGPGDVVYPGDNVRLDAVLPEAISTWMKRLAGVAWHESREASRRFHEAQQSERLARQQERERQRVAREEERERQQAAREEQLAAQRRRADEARMTPWQLDHPVLCLSCRSLHRAVAAGGFLNDSFDQHRIERVLCWRCGAEVDPGRVLQGEARTCPGCHHLVFTTMPKGTESSKAAVGIVRAWLHSAGGAPSNALRSSPVTRNETGATIACAKCGFRNWVPPEADRQSVRCGGCGGVPVPIPKMSSKWLTPGAKDRRRRLAMLIKSDLSIAGDRHWFTVATLVTTGSIGVVLKGGPSEVELHITADEGGAAWLLDGLGGRKWARVETDGPTEACRLEATFGDASAATEAIVVLLAPLCDVTSLTTGRSLPTPSTLATVTSWCRDRGDDEADLSVRAGWYPDPAARYPSRYWDGGAWTTWVDFEGTPITDLKGLPKKRN